MDKEQKQKFYDDLACDILAGKREISSFKFIDSGNESDGKTLVEPQPLIMSMCMILPMYCSVENEELVKSLIFSNLFEADLLARYRLLCPLLLYNDSEALSDWAEVKFNEVKFEKQEDEQAFLADLIKLGWVDLMFLRLKRLPKNEDYSFLFREFEPVESQDLEVAKYILETTGERWMFSCAANYIARLNLAFKQKIYVSVLEHIERMKALEVKIASNDTFCALLRMYFSVEETLALYNKIVEAKLFDFADEGIWFLIDEHLRSWSGEGAPLAEFFNALYLKKAGRDEMQMF